MDVGSGAVLGGVINRSFAFSSPAFLQGGSSNSLIYGLSNGELVSYDELGGTSRVIKTLPDSIYSSPALSGGSVYVGCDDGNFYVIDQSNGTVQKQLSFGKTVKISPAISENTLLVASSAGQLQAYGNPVVNYVWSGLTNVITGHSANYTIEAVDALGQVVPSYGGSANISSTNTSILANGGNPVAFVAGVA